MANNLSYEVLQGNSIDVLRTLDKNSVQCCVTSPPYWQQRQYLDYEVVLRDDAPDWVLEKLKELDIEPIKSED